MRAITTALLILSLSLPADTVAAQTELKISRSLRLSKPDNQCFSASFDVQHGKARLIMAGKCQNIIAIVCAYRTALTTWRCEKPPLAAGQEWLAPVPAERASVHYVGACKSDNFDCEKTLDRLYSEIDGKPGSFDPSKADPQRPPPCNDPNCPPPPPAPAPERG